MKYEVIARRYRPRNFEEVVGQESVAQTLRGGILQDRLAHAYLFAGPRGVGKTSMARIFAKAINCPVAADRSRDREEWGRPCDECAVCRAIHIGQDIDVIEMDGASHRGIDDVRGLIEGVNRPASRGRYKVYLIDEVHMLTREAFNALLKTLEEPPPHVKFVFATTEAHKIPDTVLSRCQRFDFQPIDEDAIVRRLEQICTGEGRSATPALLREVARASQGGLRDSQTLLDQLITFCDGEITADALDRLTGRVASEQIDRIVAGFASEDAVVVLDAVRACFARGADPAILLEQIIARLHATLRDRVAATAGRGSDDASAAIDRLIGSVQILLSTASDLRASAYPDVAVEVALLKLCRLEDPRALDRALERLAEAGATRASAPAAAIGTGGRAGPGAGRPPGASSPGAPSPPPGAPSLAPGAPSPLEYARSPAPGTRTRAPSSGGPAVGPPGCPPIARDPGPPACDAVATLEPGEAAESSPASTGAAPDARAPAALDRARLAALWEQILIELRRESPGVATFLADARLEGPRPGLGDDAFVVTFADAFHHAQMKSPRRLEIVERTVREVTGAAWRPRLEMRVAQAPSANSADEPGSAPASATSGDASASADRRPPADANARSSGVADHPLVNHPLVNHPLVNHPLVKKSIELFNARLV